MMKRVIVSLASAFLFVLCIPAAASAHVLKVDGDIGAVLHINPDDNPATGGSTDYIMSFNDDTGKFSLPKCNCAVSFIVSGKTQTTKSLAVSSNEVSENHYTFPVPAVYDMRFTGTPKTPGAFQPFQLDYAVRVTDGKPPAQSFPVTLWVGMGLGISLLLLAGYAMNYDTEESKRKGDT